MHTAKDTGNSTKFCCSKPYGKCNCERIEFYGSSAFDQLGHKHGVTYYAVIPPSQYISGDHAAYIQLPLNIMPLKTHNISWYCAGSNWRYQAMFC